MKTGKSKYILPVVVVTLYLVSVYVYMVQGNLKLGDAVYYALSLYPISMRDITDPPQATEAAIVWLRILCPLALSAYILSLLTSVVDWLKDAGKSLLPNSVCVYGTNEIARLVAKKNRFIEAGTSFHRFARKHVILMDSDEESLAFYRKHAHRVFRKRNSQDNVYIGLWDISASVTWEEDKVSYFNVQDETARNYWMKNSLHKDQPRDSVHRIVLLNYRADGLGYYLLKHGVLNNVFSDARRVCYDVFCVGEEMYTGFESVQLFNDDTLTWHRTPWHQHPELIRSADRILVAEDITPQLLNRLQILCTHQTVAYYSPEALDYPQTYQSATLNVCAFGLIEDVLNRESIMKSSPKWIHYRYACEHGSPQERERIAQAQKNGTEAKLAEELWGSLDRFSKNSNTAQADYHNYHSTSSRAYASSSKTARARAEHIRWCRFHFLNGWRYGDPGDGKRKDLQRRIHRDLVPWEELPQEEQEKNLQFI